jgi:hypothetical protein
MAVLMVNVIDPDGLARYLLAMTFVAAFGVLGC